MPQDKDQLLQDLVEKYAKLFMKMACSNGVPSDEAEDIVLEAIWSYYQSSYFGQLNDHDTKIFMARIIKNKSIDRYRKRKAEDEETVEDDIGNLIGIRAPRHMEPETQIISEQNYRRIHKAIDNLRPNLREAAILYFLEERNYREISEALGVSEEVCRARVSRARKFLEEELKEFLDDG